MRAAFIAFVMLIMSGQQTMAQVDPLSGATLLNACKLYDSQSNNNLYRQGVCVGIIGAMFFSASGSSFCPPPSVSNTQANRVVIQYVERTPRDQHLQLAELAERAFVDAWPCPAQQQRR
jgi:hypothetical protein